MQKENENKTQMKFERAHTVLTYKHVISTWVKINIEIQHYFMVWITHTLLAIDSSSFLAFFLDLFLFTLLSIPTVTSSSKLLLFFFFFFLFLFLLFLLLILKATPLGESNSPSLITPTSPSSPSTWASSSSSSPTSKSADESIWGATAKISRMDRFLGGLALALLCRRSSVDLSGFWDSTWWIWDDLRWAAADLRSSTSWDHHLNLGTSIGGSKTLSSPCPSPSKGQHFTTSTLLILHT